MNESAHARIQLLEELVPQVLNSSGHLLPISLSCCPSQGWERGPIKPAPNSEFPTINFPLLMAAFEIFVASSWLGYQQFLMSEAPAVLFLNQSYCEHAQPADSLSLLSFSLRSCIARLCMHTADPAVKNTAGALHADLWVSWNPL